MHFIATKWHLLRDEIVGKKKPMTCQTSPIDHRVPSKFECFKLNEIYFMFSRFYEGSMFIVCLAALGIGPITALCKHLFILHCFYLLIV